MFDLLSGGLLGTLFGGIFRLVPEVLKYFDKANERQHELAMFKEQSDLEKVRGSIRLEEIGASQAAANDAGALAAFSAAVTSQADMAKAAGGWAASLSASVRPVITYLVVGIYAFFVLYTMITSGLGTAVTFKLVMTPDFMALVSGTINYWFLDRTLTKRGL
jgi:hypothetical protein